MEQLRLHIVDELRDDDQLADLADQLADRLRDEGYDEGDRPAADSEPGARDGGLLAAGVVIIQVAIESGALTWLWDKILEWVRDGVEGAHVEMRFGNNSIKVEDATPAEKERLITHFIRETTRTP